MATKSAAKAHRQSIKKRLRNRKVRSATKSAVKHANDVIASGDLDAARDAVRAAISTLDRAAQKGVVHANNAARRKSRLLLKFNAIVATKQVTAGDAPSKPAKAAAKAPKAGAKKASKASPKAKAAKAARAKKSDKK